MHAADGDNGELWVTGSGRPMRAVRGVQNLQILFVVILRSEGAAYYAASVEGAHGLGAHPHMRPVGIDSAAIEEDLYPGVHQRILGEVAYRVDTRVDRARVADLEHLAAWYGTAHVADRLEGSSEQAPADAEVGGSWVPWTVDPQPRDPTAFVIEAPSSSGLVHTLIETGGQVAPAGVLFRATVDRAWRVLLGPAGCELAVNEGDGWQSVASDDRIRAAASRGTPFRSSTTVIGWRSTSTDGSPSTDGSWTLGLRLSRALASRPRPTVRRGCVGSRPTPGPSRYRRRSISGRRGRTRGSSRRSMSDSTVPRVRWTVR